MLRAGSRLFAEAERPWLLCFGGLLVALVLTLVNPPSLIWHAHFSACALLAAGLAAGIRRPKLLAALAVGGAVIGALGLPVLNGLVVAVLAMLIAFFAILRWNTPYTSVVLRPGLSYCVKGRKRVVPELAFRGQRPLLLKQTIIDDIVDLAEYADAFLSRHDIEYVLVYGSLLGALRQQGLIPWDDDVDFGLSREADIRMLMKDLAPFAADARKDGYILTHHATYWKLSKNNFWRYPVVDLFIKYDEYAPGMQPHRAPWEHLALCLPPDGVERTTSYYGARSLSEVVHSIPFWDSGFVPAFVTRLFGVRLKSEGGRLFALLFSGR